MLVFKHCSTRSRRFYFEMSIVNMKHLTNGFENKIYVEAIVAEHAASDFHHIVRAIVGKIEDGRPARAHAGIRIKKLLHLLGISWFDYLFKIFDVNLERVEQCYKTSTVPLVRVEQFSLTKSELRK